MMDVGRTEYCGHFILRWETVILSYVNMVLSKPKYAASYTQQASQFPPTEMQQPLAPMWEATYKASILICHKATGDRKKLATGCDNRTVHSYCHSLVYGCHYLRV